MIKYTNENEFKTIGLVMLAAANIYFLMNTIFMIVMIYLNMNQKFKV